MIPEPFWSLPQSAPRMARNNHAGDLRGRLTTCLLLHRLSKQLPRQSRREWSTPRIFLGTFFLKIHDFSWFSWFFMIFHNFGLGQQVRPGGSRGSESLSKVMRGCYDMPKLFVCVPNHQKWPGNHSGVTQQHLERHKSPQTEKSQICQKGSIFLKN